MSSNPSSVSAALAASPIAGIEREINRLQREIRRKIEAQLAKLTGQSLENLQQNQQLAAAIAQLLDSHGLRIRCEQCGHPAILRVSPRSGIPAGAFVFDHTIEGRRTFHGGSATVPAIHLVAKPRRQSTTSRAG